MTFHDSNPKSESFGGGGHGAHFEGGGGHVPSPATLDTPCSMGGCVVSADLMM